MGGGNPTREGANSRLNQACYCRTTVRGEPREQPGRRQRTFHPIFQKSANASTGPQKAQPYLILLHRQRVIQIIVGMGWWQKWHDFWAPQARGALPVQARKLGQPSTHTDPHPLTPGPGRNQARSSEEGDCQRGVLLEHFHFHNGWKWEMHGGLHAEMPRDPD
jgi:hypothetical protein